jgi:hypothetical protein
VACDRRPHALHAGVEPARRDGATTSIDAWNLDATRIGAPYVVDRDGTIYKTFADTGWIFHLGLPGTNGRYDRSSVAIERRETSSPRSLSKTTHAATVANKQAYRVPIERILWYNNRNHSRCPFSCKIQDALRLRQPTQSTGCDVSTGTSRTLHRQRRFIRYTRTQRSSSQRFRQLSFRNCPPKEKQLQTSFAEAAPRS